MLKKIAETFRHSFSFRFFVICYYPLPNGLDLKWGRTKQQYSSQKYWLLALAYPIEWYLVSIITHNPFVQNNPNLNSNLDDDVCA